MNQYTSISSIYLKGYMYFTFWFLFFNFIPPFFVNEFSDSTAILYSTCTFVFFTVGYFIVFLKYKNLKLNSKSYASSYKMYYLYILIFFLAMTVGNIFVPFLALISGYLIVTELKEKKLFRVLVISLISGAFLFEQFTRMYLLMFFLYVFLYFYFRSKRFYIFELVLLSGSGVFFLIVMLYKRVFGEIDFVRIFDYLSNIDVANFLKLIDNYFVYEAYLLTLNLIPKIHDYLYGISLIKPLFFMIPRAIWEGKPEGLTTYLGRLLYQGSKGDGYSTGMTITGEFFINFGIPGIIVLSFIFGAISAYQMKIHVTTNKIYSEIIALSYIVYFPHLVRGGIDTTVTSLFLFYIVLYSFYRTKSYYKKIVFQFKA